MKTRILLLLSLALLFLNFNYSSIEAKTEPNDEMLVNTSVSEFGLIENGSLWLLTESRLYITNNNGELWKDISPEYSQPIGSVHFTNKQLGFVLYFNQTETQKELFLVKTLDGGKSWQPVESGLEKLINENYPMPFQRVQMHWFDENHGLLLIKEATSANFSKGSLLVTRSGGMKWEAYEIPVADGLEVVDKDTLLLSDPFEESISYRSLDGGKSWLEVLTQDSEFQLKDRLGGTLSSLQTLDQEQVWAVFSDGNCESFSQEDGSSKLECELSWALSHSVDGGESWENIPLPDGKTQVDKTFSFNTMLLEQNEESLSQEELQTTWWIRTFKGHAFDACEIPKLAEMQTWFTASPFRVVNLYIGGISRACRNLPLTASYIHSMYRQGWLFIPTWVGPQAPCTNFRNRFSYNVNEAYQQGVDNANQAVAKLKELYLTNSDGTGSIVYYDLEYFPYSSQCSAAARSFVNGWTARLQQLGTRSGLYATSSNLTQNTFWNIANPPHAVWIAEWYRTPGFRPNETVWDRRYLSNDVWTHDQRILQYSGTFTGTWGGVSISIDPNVAEGPVAVPSGVDYIPPETKLSLEGQAGYEGWYKSPVKVTLTATDFYTGVKQIYYKISDDPWLPYSSPLTINRNGASHIYYRSLDNAGNWEDIQVKTIRIDTLPPENPSVISTGCQAYSGVPQPWCSDAKFTWNAATDAGVGLSPTNTYQYYWGTSYNGTAETTTVETQFDPPAIPAYSRYYFRLRAQDRNGNWSAWKTMFILHYDPSVREIIWAPVLFKK
ncbi:MAG: glycoside hydrolase domain-containing protein [Anaerolineaceae bacterium]|jgi:hypothetical protein